MLTYLSKLFEITAVAPVSYQESSWVPFLEQHGIKTVSIPIGSRKRPLQVHIRGLLSSWPYVLSTPEQRVRHAVVQFAPTHRWIHFEFHATAYAAFDPSLKGKRWITLHFPACTAYRQQMEHERDLVRKIYLKTQIPRICRLEERILRELEHVVFTSEKDAEDLGKRVAGESHVIPNGVDCEQIPFIENLTANPVALITTNFHTLQNAEGVEWFVRHVWPRVHKEIPSARLIITGSGASKNLVQLFANSAGVEYHGWVDDLASILRQARVAVIPLLFGTGTKLRLLTALLAGIPVVTTPPGSWGMETLAPKLIDVATTAEDYSHMVVYRLKHDPPDMERARVRASVEDFCWDRVAKRLAELYETYA